MTHKLDFKSFLNKKALQAGYRSGLEQTIGVQIAEATGTPPVYEPYKINYVRPVKAQNYTPDFELPNGIIIETKGYFTSDDRVKHLAIKSRYPKMDLRFVFNRSKSRLYKGSKSTYASWCEQHGFKYADKKIPEEWFKEEQKVDWRVH